MTASERHRIMARISDATGAMERNFQRTFCGASYTEAYEADWATFAQTYKMLLADEWPAVNLELRIITGKAMS